LLNENKMVHIYHVVYNIIFSLQWKELFVSFPNLKSLSVHPVFNDEGVEIVDNIKELLTDLIEFQEKNPNKLQNLGHLDVFDPL